MDQLSDTDEIEGIPDDCVSALTLYIRGNRFLEAGSLDDAILCYDKAAILYPSNSRILYNRAVALERKGENKKAQRDYAEACKNESSLIRVLATIEELERLIKLDEKNISEREQEIYLLYKGFKTGKAVKYKEIGKEYSISSVEIRNLISSIDNKLR